MLSGESGVNKTAKLVVVCAVASLMLLSRHQQSEPPVTEVSGLSVTGFTFTLDASRVTSLWESTSDDTTLIGLHSCHKNRIQCETGRSFDRE